MVGIWDLDWISTSPTNTLPVSPSTLPVMATVITRWRSRQRWTERATTRPAGWRNCSTRTISVCSGWRGGWRAVLRIPPIWSRKRFSAWRGRHSVSRRGASSEEAWLVRVLINVCRDNWRHAAVRAPRRRRGARPAARRRQSRTRAGGACHGVAGARPAAAAPAGDSRARRARRPPVPQIARHARRHAGHRAVAPDAGPPRDGARARRGIMTDWRIRLRDADRALGGDVDPRLRSGCGDRCGAHAPASQRRVLVADVRGHRLPRSRWSASALLTALQGVPLTDGRCVDRGSRCQGSLAAVTDAPQRLGSSCSFQHRGDADHLGVRSRLRSERDSAMNVRARSRRGSPRCLLSPVSARSRQAAADAPPQKADEFRPLPRRGFNVVLLLGDMQDGSGQDTVPDAARKALADMKDFLPYKGYRLLDYAVGARSNSGAGHHPAARRGGSGVRARIACIAGFRQQRRRGARAHTARPACRCGSSCGSRMTGPASRRAREADAAAPKEVVEVRGALTRDRPEIFSARTRDATNWRRGHREGAQEGGDRIMDPGESMQLAGCSCRDQQADCRSQAVDRRPRPSKTRPRGHRHSFRMETAKRSSSGPPR